MTAPALVQISAEDYRHLRELLRQKQTVPLAVDIAAGDPRVRPYLYIYVRLHRQLSYWHFRELKAHSVATELGISKQQLSRAVGALTECGYLDRVEDPADARRFHYRIESSPPDPDSRIVGATIRRT